MGVSAVVDRKFTDIPEEEFKIIKKEFLGDYITGYTTYKNIHKTLGEYGINPEYNNYFVISLLVRDYGILRNDAQKDTAFIINNILEDLLDMEHIYHAKVGGISVYIINCEEKSIEEQQMVIERFREAKRLSESILEISFVAGISGIDEGFDCLPRLFSQTLTAIDYAKFYDVDEFIYFAEIENKNEGSDEFDRMFPKETELILNIKSGRAEAVERNISAMFDSAKGIVSQKWYYQGLAYNILTNIIAITETESVPACREIINLVHACGNEPSIKELKNMLNGAAHIACACFKTESEKSNSIYAMTRRYINQHFTDHNLDVSKLGEVFNMTGFYISRIFKQHSGMKVTSYINELRIGRAKKMLVENTNMKIVDIGAGVGFDNQRTFLKVFKECEGITPTQYRNANIM